MHSEVAAHRDWIGDALENRALLLSNAANWIDAISGDCTEKPDPQRLTDVFWVVLK